MKTQLNISIVLYENPHNQVIELLRSIFDYSNLEVKVLLLDNSHSDALKTLASLDDHIDYIKNNKNLGFSEAHNIAFTKTIEAGVPYHLVVNPDIYFEEPVLDKLYDYMEKHENVGHIMPKILYPEGSIQYLCKLLPAPWNLMVRRLAPLYARISKRNELFELRHTGYNKIMNVPYLSGAFMFLRTSALEKVGLFDEKIFMYLEDLDLTRRIHQEFETIFYPGVCIYHHHQKESYRSIKLLRIHICSAIYYFNKWGWWDKERDLVNNKCLSQFE